MTDALINQIDLRTSLTDSLKKKTLLSYNNNLLTNWKCCT